jgi:hypothetical protein
LAILLSFSQRDAWVAIFMHKAKCSIKT